MFYETERFGSENTFTTQIQENFAFPVHFHRCFEFVYPLSGKTIVEIDAKKYELETGTAALIFPNQLHAYHRQENAKRYLCIFSPELVRSFTEATKNRLPSRNIFLYQQPLRSKADSLFEEKHFLYGICAELYRQTDFYVTPKTGNDTLLHKILFYIEQNAFQECTLKNAAFSVGYDYAYLSKFFFKKTGMTFKEYLNRYRIDHAQYLLTNTQSTVSETAISCGYDTIKTFNRNFLKYSGMPPSVYKKSIRSDDFPTQK